MDMDTAMTLEKQISTTGRTAYMQIRRINSIRQYLTESAAKTIIQMMVVSRLDYCNSLQYRSASLSINPAFRAGACPDCEYIECTIAIIIIVILVRSLFLVY